MIISQQKKTLVLILNMISYERKLNLIWLILLYTIMNTYADKEILTPYELDICKKDTIAFYGENCVGNALDFCIIKRRGTKSWKKTFSTIFDYTHIMDRDLLRG